MTVKIPLGRFEGEVVLERLRDLEFDDELRRVRQAWKAGDGTVRGRFSIGLDAE
jgi:hypothetical protein